jgi:flagellin
VAFRIASNVPSLVAQRYLSINQNALARSLERLSSGYRINSAADDAAGLALSENLRAQIRSYSQAERNTSTAVSMAETAENGAGEVSSVLVRLREIAVEAANGNLNSTDRGVLNTEYQELIAEVDRLAEATEFNGTELLAGVLNTIAFQVGIRNTTYDRISVTFGGVSVVTLGISNTLVSGSSATNATAAMTALDGAINNLNTKRGSLGAAVNRLSFALDAGVSTRTCLESARSRIVDVDIAAETATLATHQVLVQAGVSVLTAANQLPTLAISLLSTG